MAEKIICPACGQADQVEKVSNIYMEGIGIQRLDVQKGETPKRLTRIAEKEVWGLSRRLAPPSGGKGEVMRDINPDYAVLAFTLILPFFLSGIYNSQQTIFIPVLVGVAAAYGLYFAFRRYIIGKYNARLTLKKAAAVKAEQVMGLWIKLYYCVRDDCVFLPGDKETVPAEGMGYYLLQKVTPDQG